MSINKNNRLLFVFDSEAGIVLPSTILFAKEKDTLFTIEKNIILIYAILSIISALALLINQNICDDYFKMHRNSTLTFKMFLCMRFFRFVLGICLLMINIEKDVYSVYICSILTKICEIIYFCVSVYFIIYPFYLKFKFFKNVKMVYDNAICSICLCENNGLRAELNCGHKFHVSHILKWFYIKQTCPNCRADV